MTRFDRTLFAAGAGLIAALGGSAQATWSILIADTRTGEIVIGSATCVENFNLQHETPVLISGVGAATAQSVVDISGMNRQLIRDRLLQGVPLGAILDELAMTDVGHGNRQYGMIDVSGDALTYSGIENAAWAGGQTGRLERGIPGPQQDIVYAVQGNILSGSNVVQAAVDAIEMSNGDLAQMLMESMQAAKVAGGDGRCSCSPADPTGCGSPPPAPFKSAHIGYMLGTRAGDVDAARATYPIDGFVGAIETLDLNGDGLDEVVVGNRDTGEVSVYLNAALPDAPLSSLQLWQTLSTPVSGAVAMGAGDFDDDGTMELAIVFDTPPTLRIYEPDGQGGLDANARSFDLPGAPTGIAVGDMVLPGDDIAVAIAEPRGVGFYGYEDGDYRDWGELSLGFTPGGIEIAEFMGGHAPDLVVTEPAGSAVHVFEHGGELGFEPAVSIATLAEPVVVRGADMDLDGRNEVVVLHDAGRRVLIFREEDDVWAEWASINTGGEGIAMEIAPFNDGDGIPDVVSIARASNRNLWIWNGDGQGGYTLQTRTRVGNAAGSLAIRDMNNSGDLDLVVGYAASEGLQVLDNPGDGLLPQPGRFAEGDYFLSFNVPNQNNAAPDPVDQLQDLYDAWLLGREGRVDAVRSGVSGYGVLTRSASEVFTIELRDLHGNLLEITDPAQVLVELRDPLATIGEPVLVSGGVFEIELTAGDQIGQTRLVVHAGEGDDAVRLMPDFAISVSAFIADFNADGVCNFFDVSSYLAAYFSGDIRADIDRSGFIDFRDASAFLQSYGVCSGG